MPNFSLYFMFVANNSSNGTIDFDAVSMLTSSDQRNGYIKMALSNSTFFADSLQFVHLIEL